MAIFEGSGVAIVTPFKENMDVDYEKLGELIDWQIAEGTDAIIICGTTGESSTLSHEEHDEAIRFTVERVAKRVPVIAGTGSNSTREAIRLSRHAEECGANALLVVTPYYNKATQDGLYHHYKMIAESVSLPIIVYSVPSRTGVNVLPATMVRMARDIPNIVAIKEASSNIAQITELMSLAGDSVELYSGNDDQIVPLLALGAKGVISVLANVCPKETHEMVHSYLQGDFEKSKRLQFETFRLTKALFCEVNPIPVKAALNMMGKRVGGLRAPLFEMSDANKEVLRRELDALHLLPEA